MAKSRWESDLTTRSKVTRLVKGIVGIVNETYMEELLDSHDGVVVKGRASKKESKCNSCEIVVVVLY